MYRGPLVPKVVKTIVSEDEGIQSNFGTDLQILDPQLSLMDLSYAIAWQLGRTLAMGDQAFTAALCRLRATIHAQALEDAKQDVGKKLGSYTSQDDLLGSIEGLHRSQCGERFLCHFGHVAESFLGPVGQLLQVASVEHL